MSVLLPTAPRTTPTSWPSPRPGAGPQLTLGCPGCKIFAHPHMPLTPGLSIPSGAEGSRTHGTTCYSLSWSPWGPHPAQHCSWGTAAQCGAATSLPLPLVRSITSLGPLLLPMLWLHRVQHGHRVAMPLLKPVHPTAVFSSFNGFSSSIYSAVQHQSSPCSGAGQEASSPSAPPGAAWSLPIGTTGIVLVLGGTAGAGCDLQ